MKYFLDTEFMEGPQDKRFLGIKVGQTKPTIDLISIGIVSEELNEPAAGGGVLKERVYYAISKDFNLKEAWNRFQVDTIWNDGIGTQVKIYWLRENVLKPIWRDLFFQEDDCSGLSNNQTEAFFNQMNAGGWDAYFTFKSLKALIQKYGKTNKDIALEIQEFVYGFAIKGYDSETQKLSTQRLKESFAETQKPEFYAYYADYDWVVFCWLFGKMIDLPKGFPMYCRDLKQMLDEKQQLVSKTSYHKVVLKERIGFPVQDASKSHNAIEDARWNKLLFEFLDKI